ncbi:hypothetical protein AB7D55_004216 [Vibrio mimicus]
MINRLLEFFINIKLGMICLIIFSYNPCTSYANPIFNKGITNAYTLVEKKSFVNRARVTLFGKILWNRESEHYVLIDETGLIYLSPIEENKLQKFSKLENQVKIIGIVNKKSKVITLEILDLQPIDANK